MVESLVDAFPFGPSAHLSTVLQQWRKERTENLLIIPPYQNRSANSIIKLKLWGLIRVCVSHEGAARGQVETDWQRRLSSGGDRLAGC
ncbi:hypothetical protein I79_006236 [Cricetulus griseus]|uniref:Uncharacterized protein n=1 Tax=Cricetulus griseus TaxID=10029 RepID=G3H7A6_CRIGR|nr:hypothetical protein I79_006236 [Cricetulus griseus]